jgi:DNA processing protein
MSENSEINIKDENMQASPIIREIKKANFPGYLNNIYKAPEKLFYRGTVPRAEKYITIVGPRKPSNYAKQVCKEIVEELADFSVCIVSGLAYGIDAVAHATALECNIPCIAFPGSGIEDSVLYPQYNFNLAQSILERGGALMCQWPTSTRAAPWTFPSRNRLMAGIADAVIIIEASDKSGTLITARYALDEGRNVFVVPADITRLEALGSNSLIQMGAHPIIQIKEIPELLGFKNLKSYEEDTFNSSYDELSAEQETIIRNLQSEMTTTEISLATKLSVSQIISELQELEIQNLVNRNGSYWQRK